MPGILMSGKAVDMPRTASRSSERVESTAHRPVLCLAYTPVVSAAKKATRLGLYERATMP